MKAHNGYTIIADDDVDLETWKVYEFAKGFPYACRTTKDRLRNEFLHRVVTGAGPGDVVDHINRNTLDNRRENLRVGGYRENAINSSKCDKPCVNWHKGRWRVRLRWPDGRRIEKKFDDYDLAVEWWLDKHQERLEILGMSGPTP